MVKVIDSGGSLDTEDTNNSQLYQGCKESDKAYHCGFLSVRRSTGDSLHYVGSHSQLAVFPKKKNFPIW